MLPLDTALPHPRIPPSQLETFLKALKSIGVQGIMVDVWWRLCEPTPELYVFDRYISLFQMCSRLGLSVQATMAFHACGGNVGDDVDIPLPEWVIEAANSHHLWFKDRSGYENQEYISFGADNYPCLPRTQQSASIDPKLNPLRTPVEAYVSFIKAFVEHLTAQNLIPNVVTELQIGVGPCGELRYPSYPMQEGKWQFPGIGEFQCFDKYLLQDLQQTIVNHPSQSVKHAILPPVDTGTYNDTPSCTTFFRRGFETETGAFFLNWYSSKMLQHCEHVLKQLRDVIPISDKSVALAIKISGVHWWCLSHSRAAEATTGYLTAAGRTAYASIAKLFKKYDIVFDFTCLEMRTIDQPFLTARCGPRQLVAEVFSHARREGLAVAGENALERFDWPALAQIVSAYRTNPTRRHGFTLLRLNERLMELDNLHALRKFVTAMKDL